MDKYGGTAAAIDDLVAVIATLETEVREAIAKRGELPIDTYTLALLKKVQQLIEDEKRLHNKADQN